jgi:hypothetical protein
MTYTDLTDEEIARRKRRRRAKRNMLMLMGYAEAGEATAFIELSNNSVSEDAAVNTVIGGLLVRNGSGTYTFTETSDPDSKFNISGSSLRVDSGLDYETATQHSITVQADNSVDTPITRGFTIYVTDVAVEEGLAVIVAATSF